MPKMDVWKIKKDNPLVGKMPKGFRTNIKSPFKGGRKELRKITGSKASL